MGGGRLLDDLMQPTRADDMAERAQRVGRRRVSALPGFSAAKAFQTSLIVWIACVLRYP